MDLFWLSKRLRRWVVAMALLVAVVAVELPLGSAADMVFRRPTSAPVLDPFRLPDGQYGAGNRGIEYDTKENERIVAAARGVVVFAGPVAGSLFVTVDHGNGLETSYGFVQNILVRKGQNVLDGDLLALAAGPFHFSVRRDGEYLDPEPFFGVRRVRVRLVPHSNARLQHGSSSLGRYQIDIDEYMTAYAIPGRLGAWYG